MRYPLLVPLAVGTLLAACAKAPLDPATGQTTKPTVIAQAPANPAPTKPAAVSAIDPVMQYQKAVQAERAGRIVAPAGDNAFELLLSLREQHPDHEGYRNALFDLMPLADQAIRHALLQNDLVEADRITALMTRFDANSYVSQSSRERVTQAQAKAAKLAAVAANRQVADAITTKALAQNTEAVTPIPKQSTEPVPAPSAHTAPGNALAGTKPAVQSAVVAAAQASIAPPGNAAADKPALPASAVAPSTAAATPLASTTKSPGSKLVAPVALRRALVQYPEQAKRQGIEGFVELDVLVDKSGSPTDIKVVRSQPAGLFDRAAIRAMMRWKFQPATNQGEPVAARTRTVIQFKKS
ncbi:energy transducer TonB [Ahniella affigens]|nr:energy transducer TonB [Ahniella affigens]